MQTAPFSKKTGFDGTQLPGSARPIDARDAARDRRHARRRRPPRCAALRARFRGPGRRLPARPRATGAVLARGLRAAARWRRARPRPARSRAAVRPDTVVLVCFSAAHTSARREIARLHATGRRRLLAADDYTPSCPRPSLVGAACAARPRRRRSFLWDAIWSLGSLRLPSKSRHFRVQVGPGGSLGLIADAPPMPQPAMTSTPQPVMMVQQHVQMSRGPCGTHEQAGRQLRGVRQPSLMFDVRPGGMLAAEGRPRTTGTVPSTTTSAPRVPRTRVLNVAASRRGRGRGWGRWTVGDARWRCQPSLGGSSTRRQVTTRPRQCRRPRERRSAAVQAAW